MILIVYKISCVREERKLNKILLFHCKIQYHLSLQKSTEAEYHVESRTSMSCHSGENRQAQINKKTL